MNDDKDEFYCREFLNEERGLAAVGIEITRTGRYLDCSVTITDCSRLVTLEFNAYDADDPVRVLKKFDRLAELIATAKREFTQRVPAFLDAVVEEEAKIKQRIADKAAKEEK